ncbi:MAG TPA: hypothetical protein VK177_14425 [Flavobacteriales bacterium]|nr:hypothetical protein [Flavobacteriales bacterium]
MPSIIKDPTILSFLDSLHNLSLRKDTSALYRLIDDDIVGMTMYGLDGRISLGKSNLESFKIAFSLKKPENSFIWDALVDFTEYRVGFIYIYDKPDSILSHPGITLLSDCYERGYCLQKKTTVHENSDPNSKIIGYLNCETIRLPLNKNLCTDTWLNMSNTLPLKYNMVKISLPDGTLTGWVNGKHIYPEHFRFTIEKKNGNWKIISYFPPR